VVGAHATGVSRLLLLRRLAALRVHLLGVLRAHVRVRGGQAVNERVGAVLEALEGVRAAANDLRGSARGGQGANVD
jgi:hypothetical protein